MAAMNAEAFLELLNRAGADVDDAWELDAVDFTPEMEALVHQHLVGLDDLDLVERLLGCSQHFRKMLPKQTLLALYEKWDQADPAIDTLRGFIVQLLTRFRAVALGEWAKARIFDQALGDHRFYLAALIAKTLPVRESTPILMTFYEEMPLAAVQALGVRGDGEARTFLIGVAFAADKEVQHEIIKALAKINRRLGIPA